MDKCFKRAETLVTSTNDGQREVLGRHATPGERRQAAWLPAGKAIMGGYHCKCVHVVDSAVQCNLQRNFKVCTDCSVCVRYGTVHVAEWIHMSDWYGTGSVRVMQLR